MNPVKNTYTLLALCARAQSHPTQAHQLRQQTTERADWDSLYTQAEIHGLTSLLYVHLQAADVSVPTSIQQQLQARTLQHSHANQVRARVLAEVLEAFQIAGIEVLVLKGAALAHWIYPKPSLRPMRDVDLLVTPAQARQAQALLAELGFNAPLPGAKLPDKHLPLAHRQLEGVAISVEIHHNLYAKGSPATELEALKPRGIPLTIAGQTIYTLGYEATLEYIYQHLRVNLLLDSLRLIWVADLVSLAERFASEIDWARVNPHLLKALALCHWLTPLSEELLTTVSLKTGRPPRDLGLEFQGWPRYSLALQRHKGYWGIWRDSFYPTEGWLRLYYGLGSGPSLWWGQWVQHPLHILAWVADYGLNRVKR